MSMFEQMAEHEAKKDITYVKTTFVGSDEKGVGVRLETHCTLVELEACALSVIAELIGHYHGDDAEVFAMLHSRYLLQKIMGKDRR